MALKDEKNFDRFGQNYGTMIPGSFAKRMRTCVVWQFIRFLMINLKMIKVVSKSH
jgi:hypothetical protein